MIERAVQIQPGGAAVTKQEVSQAGKPELSVFGPSAGTSALRLALLLDTSVISHDHPIEVDDRHRKLRDHS